MRTIIFLMLSIFLLSCEKEECVVEIQDDLSNDIYYNKHFCDQGSPYERIYYTVEDFENDSTCTNLTSSLELGFDGIIAAYGVNVPFAFNNGNYPYELDVKVTDNKCENIIELNFILRTIDTLKYLPNNRNVIVFLNNFDDSYEVEFSHEIIPYGG